MTTQNERNEAKENTITSNHDAPTQDRLVTVLNSIESLMIKQTALKYAFARGLVYGLGTVLGATILIALLGGVLVTTLDSLSNLPFIGNYIDDSTAEYFESAQNNGR